MPGAGMMELTSVQGRMLAPEGSHLCLLGASIPAPIVLSGASVPSVEGSLDCRSGAVELQALSPGGGALLWGAAQPAVPHKPITTLAACAAGASTHCLSAARPLPAVACSARRAHAAKRVCAGRSTSMRGRLAAPLEAARQAELEEVPRASRLHRWVSHVLPQEPRPAAPANTARVTGTPLARPGPVGRGCGRRGRREWREGPAPAACPRGTQRTAT